MIVLDISVNKAILLLEYAFLRDLWDLFFSDPAPDMDHVVPPLTKQAWWLMIVIAFSITAFALYYLQRPSERTPESNV